MPYCVAMFEFAHPDERLDASQQLNEIFGPFELEADADAFAERASKLFGNSRHWVIMRMSQQSSINACDPTIN